MVDVPDAYPTSRRRGPDVATLLGLGFALWGLSIGLGRLSDNSLFTHIATGRLILDSGIPRTDPYSFTALGERWVVQSWLASVLLGLVDRWGGVDAIRLLMGVLTAVLSWLVWQLTRPAKTLIGRIVITGLVVGVGSSVWSPRPLLIGLVLMGVLLLAAEGRIPPWVLAPVMWVWVNSHGSFPLALVALAALAWGRKLDGQDPRTEWRCLGWATGGTLLGVVNPLGPVILWFPVHLLSRQEVLREVMEWQSPSFSIGWARLFLVQILLAVVVLVRRPSYRAAIPLVVFTAAALVGMRNVAVASLVIVPGMARGMADLGTLRGSERPRGIWAGFVVVVLVGVLVVRSALGAPGYDLGTYPVDAVAFVEQSGWRRPDVAVATPETVGNYLELIYGTDARAFLDDRVDMYPPDAIGDFLKLLHGRPGWQEVLARDRVDVVLWDATAPLAQLLSEDPGWRIAYADGRWVVACRRSSTSMQAAAAQGAAVC